jgi:beta-glucosidase
LAVGCYWDRSGTGTRNRDVANNRYHRYREDVALVKSIGATAYRFSGAWPADLP